jgi:site-specific recombinase XerD
MSVLNLVITTDKAHLEKTIDRHGNHEGIVTTLKINDDEFEVLSRYEDNIWKLPKHLFPINAPDHLTRLNFQKINSLKLRNEAKIVMFKYLQEQPARAGSSIVSRLHSAISWLNWLHTKNISSHQEVTELTAMQFVQHVNTLKNKSGKNIGKQNSVYEKNRKFSSVEFFYKYLIGSYCEFTHPWPDSSAHSLSGGDTHRYKSPKTLIIPDEILKPLAQHAHKVMSSSKALFGHRDALKEHQNNNQMSDWWNNNERNNLLEARGWDSGLRGLRNSLKELQASCFLWILLTTGMRSHEVLSIKRDQWHSKLQDNERYYFIGSRSEKTHEGDTYWLCPESAIYAVKILERHSEVLQNKLEEELIQAKYNGEREEFTRLKGISGAVSLVTTSQRNNRITALSGAALSENIQKLVTDQGLECKISPHQFRRTFASYVAHHQLGDLRYLRDHFKHWSLDMTSLYTINEQQDDEIIDEIYSAFDDLRQGIIGHWLEPNTPLTGGIALQVLNLRNKTDEIRTYKDRAEMIRSISEQVHIRATSLAWCTNDDDSCAGGQCESCGNSLVDDTHRKFWAGIYAQQIELRLVDDIGNSGKVTVERTIKRCEQVLTELGADIKEIKAGVMVNGR